MFGRHSSAWHLVCPQLLSVTSTEKPTQKFKSSDYHWRRVWVSTGQCRAPRAKGLCQKGPVLLGWKSWLALLSHRLPTCAVGTSFSSLLLLVPCVKSRCCLTLPHQGAVNMVSFWFEEALVVAHPRSFKKFSLVQTIFGTSAWPQYLGGSPW